MARYASLKRDARGVPCDGCSSENPILELFISLKPVPALLGDRRPLRSHGSIAPAQSRDLSRPFLESKGRAFCRDAESNAKGIPTWKSTTHRALTCHRYSFLHKHTDLSMSHHPSIRDKGRSAAVKRALSEVRFFLASKGGQKRIVPRLRSCKGRRDHLDGGLARGKATSVRGRGMYLAG